jgi:hypothetical protein
LRASLGARRLELRTPKLAEAERMISSFSGPREEILDVQRFGDRLDLLVQKTDQAKRLLNEMLGAAGVPTPEIHEDEPTLENVFVAKLRSLGAKSSTKSRFLAVTRIRTCRDG